MREGRNGGKLLDGGKPGNKGGGSAPASLRRKMREKLAQDDGKFADALINAILAKGIRGDVNAAKMIFDQIEGPPPQTVNVTIGKLAALGDDELNAGIEMLERGEIPPGFDTAED